MKCLYLISFGFVCLLLNGLVTGAQQVTDQGLELRRDHLLVFNPNNDITKGETAEYITLATIMDRIPSAASTILIGLGEVFPFLENNRTAYEAFVWRQGNEIKAYSSDPVTGAASVLNTQAPLTFSVFAAVDATKGVSFVYDAPGQSGRVLWNFYVDNTVKQILFFKKGFHNSYSGTDGKSTETLFKAAKDAHNKNVLESKWRSKLAGFIPSLSQDPVWENFSTSAVRPEIEGTWLDAMRKQGWPAAALVMEGALLDTNHFRVTEVKKVNPQDVGLKPKNYFLENNADSSNWSIVGYMIDPRHAEFQRWQSATEAFGQGIHFHGARSDRSKMGHILTAVLGDKPFKVTMYPLGILQGADSGIFNNDLSMSFKNDWIGQSTLEATVENAGANFVRNVEVVLRNGPTGRTLARTVIPVIKPAERITVPFNLENAGAGKVRVCGVLDPAARIIEGGLMKANNNACLD